MNSLFLRKEIDKINNELLSCLDIFCLQKYGIKNLFTNKQKEVDKLEDLISHIKKEFPNTDNEKIIKKLRENQFDFVCSLKLILLLSKDIKTYSSKTEKYERIFLEKIASELKIFRNYINHYSEEFNDEELNQRFFQTSIIFFKLLKFPKYQLSRSLYIRTELVAKCNFWAEANAINDSCFNFGNFTFIKKNKEIDYDEDEDNLSKLNIKKFIRSLSKPVKMKFGTDYKFKEKPNKITFKPIPLVESISEIKSKQEVNELKKENPIINDEFSLLTVISNK